MSSEVVTFGVILPFYKGKKGSIILQMFTVIFLLLLLFFLFFWGGGGARELTVKIRIFTPSMMRGLAGSSSEVLEVLFEVILLEA